MLGLHSLVRITFSGLFLKIFIRAERECHNTWTSYCCVKIWHLRIKELVNEMDKSIRVEVIFVSCHSGSYLGFMQ